MTKPPSAKRRIFSQWFRRFEVWIALGGLIIAANLGWTEIFGWAVVPWLSKPYYTEVRCDFEPPDSGTVECGHLYVNEQEGNNSGATIKLLVVRYQPRSDDLDADPILVVEGGPGFSPLSHPLLAKVAIETENETLNPHGNRELVFFSQRGTSGSDPSLDCPEYDMFIEGLRPSRRSNATTSKCRDRLIKEGIDLTAYNSRAIAQDMEDIRQALSIKTWNLYGASYGSRIVLEYVRRHSDVVRSIVIEGVLPSDLDGHYGDAELLDALFSRIHELCLQQEKCKQSYPHALERLEEKLRSLKANPIEVEFISLHKSLENMGQVTERVNVDDVFLIDLLFNALYSAEDIADLPKLIYELPKGTALTWNNHFGLWDLENFGPAYSDGMAWSVVCNDEGEKRTKAKKEIGNAGRYLKAWVEEINQSNPCLVWPIDDSNQLDTAPVHSNVPALILAGEFDPVTPPDGARKAARTLSKSHFYSFPGNGHDASSNLCAQTIIRSFLEEPLEHPDDSCFKSQRSPRFTTVK